MIHWVGLATSERKGFHEAANECGDWLMGILFDAVGLEAAQASVDLEPTVVEDVLFCFSLTLDLF